jgi:hypothetical protein
VDLERVVRSYGLYAQQERPPADEVDQVRDVKILRGDDGTGQLVITLGQVEVEEFAATFQAFLDRRDRPQPGDQSSGEDPNGGEAPMDQPTRAAKKADAFMDLVRTALAHADGGQAAGDDRYLVHVVARHHGPDLSFLDGRPLEPAEAAMMACDASTVTHTVTDDGEPLNLGRKTRQWSTAQRRAISVRDGGHCRFPGCGFRHYDVHHLREWEAGGATDIDNGMCACRRHHRLLHHGFRVEGNPNSELGFHRPDGTHIGATYPAAARRPALV